MHLLWSMQSSPLTVVPTLCMSSHFQSAHKPWYTHCTWKLEGPSFILPLANVCVRWQVKPQTIWEHTALQISLWRSQNLTEITAHNIALTDFYFLSRVEGQGTDKRGMLSLERLMRLDLLSAQLPVHGLLSCLLISSWTTAVYSTAF